MGIVQVDLVLTLDGVHQGPVGLVEDRSGGSELGGWQGASFDDESGETIGAGIERLDALLLGRRTYDIFAGYWPAASEVTRRTRSRRRRCSAGADLRWPARAFRT